LSILTDVPFALRGEAAERWYQKNGELGRNTVGRNTVGRNTVGRKMVGRKMVGRKMGRRAE
jgi:hypothetical protein